MAPRSSMRRAQAWRREPGRGQEAQEGRQSRERPANLPVDRDPGAPEPGLFRHAGSKRRRGDAAAVASRRGGGIPWRAEIPGEDRLPSCGVTAADRSTDFRIELKPLKARSKPAESSRAALKSLFGAERTPRGDAERVELGRTPRRTPTDNARRGKGCREASRRSEGKPSEGRTPGAPPVRNKTGRVSGGTKRQEAEEA
jgi:hypothetical protein